MGNCQLPSTARCAARQTKRISASRQHRKRASGCCLRCVKAGKSEVDEKMFAEPIEEGRRGEKREAQ